MASFLKLMFSTPEETQTSKVKDDITASAEEASGRSEFTGNISLSMQPPANPDDTPMLGVEPNSLPSSLSQDQRNAALQSSSYPSEESTLLSKDSTIEEPAAAHVSGPGNNGGLARWSTDTERQKCSHGV